MSGSSYLTTDAFDTVEECEAYDRKCQGYHRRNLAERKRFAEEQEVFELGLSPAEQLMLYGKIVLENGHEPTQPTIIIF